METKIKQMNKQINENQHKIDVNLAKFDEHHEHLEEIDEHHGNIGEKFEQINEHH